MGTRSLRLGNGMVLGVNTAEVQANASMKMELSVSNNSKKLADGIDLERTEREEYIQAVFGNSLIFGVIGDHLGISDLKILRQTSHLLLNMVNGYRNFIPKLKVTVREESIDSDVFNDHTATAIEWKNAKFAIDRTAHLNFFTIPTGTLTDLHLFYPDKCNSSLPWSMELHRMSQNREGAYGYLKSNDFTNLESLTLDLTLFRHDLPSNALIGIVGSLKSLRFTGTVPNLDEIPLRQRMHFNVNMRTIGGLAWRLKSLCSESSGLTMRGPISKPEVTATALGAILASSVETIEKIKLSLVNFEHLSQVHQLRFPCLRKLKLTIRGNVEDQFAEFLNSQPQLESFGLHVCGYLLPVVMDAIRNICGRGPKLYTFGLDAFGLLERFADQNSWTFIQDLVGLKKFRIKGLQDLNSGRIMTYILSCLPPSVQLIDKFFISYQDEGLGLQGSDEAVSALTGFTNLTHLGIVNCGNFVNDVTLQSICRTLTKLRVLRFGTPYSQVTDFGITGESSCPATPDSGVALSNLRGLQELWLIGCDNVTQQGLIKAVQFRELRMANFCGPSISNSALLEIAKNNPSLELVTRTLDRTMPVLEEEDLHLRASILAVNPRLTKITTDYKPGDVRNTYVLGNDWSSFSLLFPTQLAESFHMPSYGVPSRRRLLDESAIAAIRMSIPSELNRPRLFYYYAMLQ